MATTDDQIKALPDTLTGPARDNAINGIMANYGNSINAAIKAGDTATVEKLNPDYTLYNGAFVQKSQVPGFQASGATVTNGNVNVPTTPGVAGTPLSAQQQTAINGVLERFKADPAHRYFENVEPLMSQLISSGLVQRTGDHMADLKSAYEAACYQNPEVRGLLIKEQIAADEAGRKAREKDAAEKARQASRSITGSPSGAVRESDSTNRRGSSHDDAAAAYREVMGARV